MSKIRLFSPPSFHKDRSRSSYFPLPSYLHLKGAQRLKASLLAPAWLYLLSSGSLLFFSIFFLEEILDGSLFLFRLVFVLRARVRFFLSMGRGDVSCSPVPFLRCHFVVETRRCNHFSSFPLRKLASGPKSHGGPQAPGGRQFSFRGFSLLHLTIITLAFAPPHRFFAGVRVGCSVPIFICRLPDSSPLCVRQTFPPFSASCFPL